MKFERRTQLYTILLVTVLGVGSALGYITLKDWNIYRMEPRTFEGIISDMKFDGPYYRVVINGTTTKVFDHLDVMVVNGTESEVFDLKRSMVFKTVFGKFDQKYQAVNIGDSVKFTYHMTIYWEKLVDEVTIKGELK